MMHGFQGFLCAKFDSNKGHIGAREGQYTLSGPSRTLNGIVKAHYQLFSCT